MVFSKIGIEGIPVYNVENACASGSSAFNLAVQSLKAGTTDVALALGAEKMNIPDKAKAFAIFEGGWDVSRAEETYATLVKMGEGITPPPGSESDRPYSKFMAIYAAFCRWHMKTYGTTQRQIAAVCAKNHQHSVHNPYSQFRKPFTIEEVLAAPPITYPLTLPMCAPLSDGSAAAILAHRGRPAAHRRRPQALHQGGGQRRPQLHPPAHGRAREAHQPAGRAAGLRDRGPRPRGHGRGRGARRLGDGRDHPVREPRASCRWAAAARRPSAASSRSAGACRSIPRAASSPRAIRSARPASASCTSW
ncbi:MAG: thiolase family protein [Desulfosudis oleivorans]|nr:thiolase family protein [Desulfosudis oleivorans]